MTGRRGVAGCRSGWIDPDDEKIPDDYFQSEAFAKTLQSADCIVLVNDHPDLDLAFLRKNAPEFIDARDHGFSLTNTASVTAANRDDQVQVVYTGVVPIVFKAQRTLLYSLMDSIGWAFVMIALVGWHKRLTFGRPCRRWNANFDSVARRGLLAYEIS